MRVQAHAAFDEGAQADIALQDNQRAGLVSREMLHRQQDLIHRFQTPIAAAEPEPALAPQARQGAPDLGLEQDDDGYAKVGDDERKDRPQRLQARSPSRQVERDHDQDPHQDVAGPRATDHHQGLVDQERDHQNIDDRIQVQGRQRR